MSIPTLTDLRTNAPFSAVQLASFHQLLAQRRARKIELVAEHKAATLLLEASVQRRQENQDDIDALVAVFAPIRRVPDDLLTEIFLWCIDIEQANDLSYSTLHSWRCPVLLTHVCAYWRRIALLTPLLWTRVWFLTPAPLANIEALTIVLHRSNNAPLWVNLRSGHEDRHGDSVQLFGRLITLNPCRFVSRLETLELDSSFSRSHELTAPFEPVFRGDPGPPKPRFTALRAVILQDDSVGVLRLFQRSTKLQTLILDPPARWDDTSPVRFPSSTDFAWSGITQLHVGFNSDLNTMLVALGACVNLETLTLAARFSGETAPEMDEMLTMTALQTLTIAHPDGGKVLKSITTPALRHLRLRAPRVCKPPEPGSRQAYRRFISVMLAEEYELEPYTYDDTEVDFMDLCERSSGFSLETFEIHSSYYDLGESQLDVFLLANPNIWRLVLIGVCDSGQALIRRLQHTTTTDNLLPGLREITIALDDGQELQKQAKYVRRMLRSRLSASESLTEALEYAKVVVGGEVWEARGESIRRCLKELR
ncbi:hypothetical protein C8F01DRAFT_117819 [Mycena amicta]|nr:hypothetical protein C8F01DRAFT_117819 [Mycena amicta]